LAPISHENEAEGVNFNINLSKYDASMKHEEIFNKKAS
jgi:hypothetical protein